MILHVPKKKIGRHGILKLKRSHKYIITSKPTKRHQCKQVLGQRWIHRETR